MTDQPTYIASCSFGKDSLATILLALEHNEPLDRAVFCEVMFDHARGISGELPEHIEWVRNIAIPKLESWGIPVDVVKSKSDYVSLCRRVLTKGAKQGCMYGVQNCFPCYANSELKIKPLTEYFRGKNVVQYVGIGYDEKKRLQRLTPRKISLLAKFKHSTFYAEYLCQKAGLLSPCYSLDKRVGCWFCYNARLSRYAHIKKHYPEYWEALRNLYYETQSKAFKYNQTFDDIDHRLDFEQRQLKLF